MLPPGTWDALVSTPTTNKKDNNNILFIAEKQTKNQKCFARIINYLIQKYQVSDE